jgi:preprotein translocase subunit YajC
MDPTGLLLLGGMIVVFYFLIIRPQQRQRRQHQDLISSIEPGDEIVSIGGIFGRVRSIDDSVVMLEVADGTVLKIARGAISRKIWEEDAEQQEDTGEAAGPSE